MQQLQPNDPGLAKLVVGPRNPDPALPATQRQDKIPFPSQPSFWDAYRGHPPVCNSMCRMSTRLCAVAKAHSVHLWIFSLACILPTWS